MPSLHTLGFSLQYIRTIREQIVESRDTHDIPIFIVGNKHDLSEDRDVPRREVCAAFPSTLLSTKMKVVDCRVFSFCT